MVAVVAFIRFLSSSAGMRGGGSGCGRGGGGVGVVGSDVRCCRYAVV